MSDKSTSSDDRSQGEVSSAVELAILPKWLRAVVHLVALGQISQTKAAEREWIEGIRGFLDANVTLRKSIVFLSAIVAPALIVIFSFNDQIHLSKPIALAIIVTLSAVAMLLGAVVVWTEQSSGELAASLGQAEHDLEGAHERLRQATEEKANLARRHTARLRRIGGLEQLRSRLSELVSTAVVIQHRLEKPLQRQSAVFLMVNELAVAGPEIFGFQAGEGWTLAAYLWEADARELVCVANFRPAGNDYGEGHRSWAIGRGMVGMTFWTAKRLVVSNAATSELEAVMRDRDAMRAERDRGTYKSVAAVPIFDPNAFDVEGEGASKAVLDDPDAVPPLFGVVVATSDQGGRFSARASGEVSLTALEALAEAVGIVLIAAELKGVATNDPESDRVASGKEDEDVQNPAASSNDGAGSGDGDAPSRGSVPGASHDVAAS